MTYKKDNRTRFWIAIYDDQDGKTIYVADCLKEWFALRFPDVMSVCSDGWSVSTHGKPFFRIAQADLGRVDWAKLDSYLKFAGNECFWPKIPGHSIDDRSLSYCVVGDYTQCPDDQDRQTEMGRAFHAAKYEALSQDEKHSYEDILVQRLKGMIPLFDGCYDLNKTVVSHIPVAKSQTELNLGRRLAMRVASSLSIPFLSTVIDCEKPQLKGLRLDEKLVAWENIYRNGTVNTSLPLTPGTDVLIVDDLYQSGTTMWAYARHLKALGAGRVIGLACVKSLNDSDNVSR